MSYHLQFATLSDDTDLVNIFVAALSDHRIIKLKVAHHHEDAGYVGSLIEAPLKSWLTRTDRYRVLKACVNDPPSATGKPRVIGWICWGFHGSLASQLERLSNTVGLSELDILASPQNHSHQHSLSQGDGIAEVAAVGTAKPFSVKREMPPKHSVSEIEAQCADAMQQWISDMTPNDKKSMFIGSLCVVPDMQGRGVSSALLDWGVRLADFEQLPAWVQSSESGWKAFSNKDFRDVRALEIGIDDYTDDESLSPSIPYVYHYMTRRPQLHFEAGGVVE